MLKIFILVVLFLLLKPIAARAFDGPDVQAPEKVRAEDYQTYLQKALQIPLVEYGVDRMTRIKNKEFNPYDTEKLKINVDPTVTSIYNNLKGETSGNSEFYKKMDAAADAFKSPTLDKNFLTFDQDAFYESQMNPMRREAELIKKQNRDESFELGLGNSTIVGNRNAEADRNLMDRSLDASSRSAQLFYDAGMKAKQLSNEATTKEAEMANESNKNYVNTNFLTKNALVNDQNRLLGVADKIQQTDMYNKNVDYNEFMRKEGQLDKDMQNILSMFTGQNAIQVAGMNNAQQSNMAYYNTQNQAAQNQNNLFGSLIGLAGGGLK